MVSSSPARRALENKQPRRLLLALGLLMIALIAVVAHDWQFWFGGSDDSTLEADAAAPEVTHAVAAKAVPVIQPAKSVQPHATKKPIAVEPTVPDPAPVASADPAPANSGVTATRTVLPPLDVEVVAGDKHSTIRPGSNSTKVEITNPASTLLASNSFGAPTNAAERERMSTSIHATQGAYDASYPLLAQHMNVQGSVVLQALIGADGVIENLRVLSGPSILTSAAQQAVREWHFKPYLQNGQPVETKARITVNFTIKVADSSSKTS